MEKQIINTGSAPAPIGPYNQAVRFGNLLFVSGQICLDPETGTLCNNSLEEETHQVMRNLKAILSAAGLNFSHVLKTTIFLTDMHRFGDVNAIYGTYFDGHYPARETVQVSALPRFVQVEISVIAASAG